MAKKTTIPPSLSMMSNSAHEMFHTTFVDDNRKPHRCIVKDDILILTDDMSQFDGLTSEAFATSVVVESGDNLKPIPPRSYETDGVHGRDRLLNDFDNANVVNNE